MVQELNNGCSKDEKEKQYYESLFYYAARMVYYLNCNAISNLEKIYHDGWLCVCPESKKYIGKCKYCILFDKFSSYNTFHNKNINKIIEEHLKLIDEFKKDPSLEVDGDDFVSTFDSRCERIKVGLRESIFHGRWLKFY